jgi:hypothetical protein
MTDTSAQKPTALNLLREEIERFLASTKPEVLCIRGKWGVGKTYTWEMILREAHVAEGVKLSTYSYVSLFGLEGLDRLKASVFENAIAVENVGTEPSIESLGASLKSLGKAAAAAWKPGLGTLADHAAFLAVNKFIICIDDLERKGKNLRIIDILGLASLLKERRKCKIVLILNDEELEKGDQDAFELYSEKVIDTSLVFEPTPQESAEIALKGQTAHERLLAEYCIKLTIANIRILKKLERLVQNVEPSLRAFDPRVLNQAVATLALFGWAVYGKQSALLDFALNKRYRSRYGLNDGKLSDDEKALDDMLEAYPFGVTDAFDRVLLEGIKTGFFDTPQLLKEAAELDQTYKNAKIQEVLNKPWDDYRESFDDNAEFVSIGLSEAIKNHTAHVVLSYIDGAMMFLKRMGKPELAAAALTRWMEENAGLPKASFDVVNLPFAPQDPDLAQAMRDKFASYEDNREPASVLFDMAKNHGWNDEDVTLLSMLTEDDFYKLFKSLRGLELRSVIRKALELGKQGQVGDTRYTGIERNALLALGKLGQESVINAQRIRGLYNIGIKDDFVNAD